MTRSVLVTRPVSSRRALVAGLRANGLRVHAVPTVRMERTVSASDLRTSIGVLSPLDWVAVTSPFAAGLVGRAGQGLAQAGLRWAAIGSATADVLARFGVIASAVAPDPEASSLVAAMLRRAVLSGRRVHWIRAEGAGDELVARLLATGASVTSLDAYRTVEGPPGSRLGITAAIRDRDLTIAVVASGSAARGLATLLATIDQNVSAHVRRLPVVSIGPSTTRASEAAGLLVSAEATSPSVAGLIDAVTTALARSVPPVPAMRAPSQ